MKENYLKNVCLKELNLSDNFENLLISNLNFEQLIAVKSLNGNFLVLAGAGSGKTRVIIYRALLLLKLQIPPKNILILTFTRKAINEIKERIQAFIPDSNINIETFHSLAYRSLKKYTQNKNFQILNSDNALEFANSSTYYAQISKFLTKDEIIKCTTSIKDRYTKSIFFKNLNKTSKNILLNFFNDINLRKKQTNFYTFDDLLNEFYKYLHLNIIPTDFKYIMIDEYQDTDNIQIEILKILSKNSFIMAVGDDYQSIYSFKGSSTANILNFSNDFKDSKTFILKENYRCSKNILNLSNEFSKCLRYSFRKTLTTQNISNSFPILNIFKTHTEEINFIISRIKNILSSDSSANIVILFRNYIYMENSIKLFKKNNLIFNITQNPFLENIFKNLDLNESSQITLSTIHSSKGLEWDYVFIPLLLDGIIPTSIGTDINIEEEKRLFYVAITRAKKELILTYPLSFYNSYGLFSASSPFIDNIDSNFFNIKRG